MFISIPAQLGYPALAGLVFGESAGVPLPGETALIAAGGLAASGELSLPFVIIVAALSAIVGDGLGYLIGRRGGRRLLLHDGLGARYRRGAVAHADRFFERYGPFAILFGRFIPALRVIAALFAGATKMPWPRFVLANAIGAFAWAGTVATLASVIGATGAGLVALGGLLAGGIVVASARWRDRCLPPADS